MNVCDRKTPGERVRAIQEINKKSPAGASCWNSERRRHPMKGYVTSAGYMGLVDGQWILFATESDYLEYLTG